MKTDIICVGKIKEKYFRDAIAEYSKRLSRFTKLSILEVSDEPAPEGASAAEEAQILKKEGDRLLSRLDDGAYKIILAVDGVKTDSPGLARRLHSVMVGGCSHIQLVIGGSLGLSPEVQARADLRLSFSDMTFPHQLMRVILLEQLYRAFKIMYNEPYHK